METLAILQFGHTLCHIIRSTFTNILGLHNNEERESDKTSIPFRGKKRSFDQCHFGGFEG